MQKIQKALSNAIENFIPEISNSKPFACMVCKITFHSRAALQQHLLSVEHTQLLKLKKMKPLIIGQISGVFVTGFSSSCRSDLLLSYFSRFGTIVWICRKNFLMVEYAEQKSVEKILRLTQHFVNGEKLFVKERESSPQDRANVQPTLESQPFMERLKTTDGISEQVAALIAHVQGDQSYNFTPPHGVICRDLYEVIRYSYPRCQLHPFGSSITGLHFWTSDVDVYISGIRRGNTDEKKLLYILKGILSRSDRFTNLFVIGQAKIPILKCVHVPTNTSCDINVRNMLGVCNSRLIRYYQDVDYKIKEMMIIIKYWAKIHKLTGANTLFTNYSLCMMIIFLFQGKPYELPSVEYLQQEREDANIQDGWNGGFRKVPVISSHLHNSSLLDLLANFFSFYADFDYGTYVICPYLGQPLKKTDFREPDSLPDVFTVYKRVVKSKEITPLKVESVICIQDPFEQIRNVTSAISLKVLQNFVNLCTYGKQMVEQEKQFLFKLFYSDPPNLEREAVVQNDVIKFSIQMSPHFNYLSKQVDEDVADKTAVIKEAWFNSVKEFMITVLKCFLRISVEEINHSGGKVRKLNHTSDVSNDAQIAHFRCSAKLAYWPNRKRSLGNKDVKSLIEREKAITAEMDSLFKDITPLVNILEFDLFLEKRIDPAQVLINLIKINSYKKTFKGFGHFISNHFGNWFEEYERELNSAS
ncbi:speckle targeted PIP5K1A-regulated poly(A) polymerase-like [Diabrotica virgifera virgifera]|uniref:Speckle targeted PIP5K1A-regulated poly(A) polymerase n=1 Tax=Diabrotica virgifera virgifera TaxID=50390 RepID=A0A6P7FKY1_DIAVI|nr:speckle targeted PIP5K1A-regulated poly(A) polymerase-like [Diabrotica virgifera virgifera]XP_050511805.1 speckle targeted PIP5K1A-regulated poly(A) polymerase-like [Diabrotica virgifera virgifera]